MGDASPLVRKDRISAPGAHPLRTSADRRLPASVQPGTEIAGLVPETAAGVTQVGSATGRRTPAAPRGDELADRAMTETLDP
jgi:hypothetical protein